MLSLWFHPWNSYSVKCEHTLPYLPVYNVHFFFSKSDLQKGALYTDPIASLRDLICIQIKQ